MNQRLELIENENKFISEEKEHMNSNLNLKEKELNE